MVVKKGGKHATGSYGCVINPSLIITNGKRDPNFVTKIFYTDRSYYEEKASCDLAKKVDPKGTFLNCIYDERPIDITRAFLSKEESDRLNEPYEENLKECRIRSPQDIQHLKYLNYRNLGYPINDIIKKKIQITPDKIPQIVYSGYILLANIIYMNEVGYYHNDVHEENITYNEKDSKFYLIDLGRFSTNPEDKHYPDSALCFFRMNDIVNTLYRNFNQQDKKFKILADFEVKFTSLNYDLRRYVNETSDINQTMKYFKLEVKKVVDNFIKAYTEVGGGKRKTRKMLYKKSKQTYKKVYS